MNRALGIITFLLLGCVTLYYRAAVTVALDGHEQVISSGAQVAFICFFLAWVFWQAKPQQQSSSAA